MTQEKINKTEIEVSQVVEQKSAIDEAVKELEELKAKLAEAKTKLAKAKKATTKSRPVRMSTFIARVCIDKENALIGRGEQIMKTDVHYCAEKSIIDILTEDIKSGNTNEYVYTVVKRSKANEAEETIVELIWIDQETNQIVIE